MENSNSGHILVPLVLFYIEKVGIKVLKILGSEKDLLFSIKVMRYTKVRLKEAARFNSEYGELHQMP